MTSTRTRPIRVEIEERLHFMGYAHFEEPRGNGRVFWQLVPKGNHHSLEISPSHGIPSDAALALIRDRLNLFVQGRRPVPPLSALMAAKAATR